MSRLKKDHVLGAGGSALAIGALGAALGALAAGVPGLAVGAIAGTALGAVIGHKASEAVDKRGDLGHFKQIYRTMPYYVSGTGWDDYEPAYRLGLRHHPTRGADAAPGLEAEWERDKGASRLLWSEAEPAVAHVWRELDKSQRAARNDTHENAHRASDRGGV